MAKSYYSQFVTNATFFATYPMVKFINLFEFEKFDDEVYRDYRVTHDAVLPTFKSDLTAFIAANPHIYVMANSTSSIPTSAGPASATSTAATPAGTLSASPAASTGGPASTTLSTKSSGMRLSGVSAASF
ncbi:hypothetical protein HK101_005903, partial [Irineochytrium annulatum]